MNGRSSGFDRNITSAESLANRIAIDPSLFTFLCDDPACTLDSPRHPTQALVGVPERLS
jgi:hypothetical protein